MQNCYFCGGRVIALSGETVAGRGRHITAFRCEAEGVRWDATENLIIYTPTRQMIGRIPSKAANLIRE